MSACASALMAYPPTYTRSLIMAGRLFWRRGKTRQAQE